MGYPLVDLERFPIDRSALAMLPRRAAIAYRMLPLLRDGARLVVAVDRPGRVLKLREDPDHAALQLLPALALKSQIMAAMDRQSGDGWNADASERADFFDTTT
jgi:type IV pilus assembly protein PilB